MEKIILGTGIVLLSCFSLFAQKDRFSTPGGGFWLGGRSTLSSFNDHPDEKNGLGVGGQFRIRLAERLNTEWFFDYLNSDLGNYASRRDFHIGWSVMYDLLPPSPTRKLQPYALAGHCFDYTQIRGRKPGGMTAKRLSSAVQGGLGTYWHLSPKINISLSAQYMIHLGKHLHGHLKEDGSFHIHEEARNGLEGHLLFTLSFNYKLAELW